MRKMNYFVNVWFLLLVYQPNSVGSLTLAQHFTQQEFTGILSGYSARLPNWLAGRQVDRQCACVFSVRNGRLFVWRWRANLSNGAFSQNILVTCWECGIVSGSNNHPRVSWSCNITDRRNPRCACALRVLRHTYYVPADHCLTNENQFVSYNNVCMD